MKQLWQSISTGEASVVEVPAPAVGKGNLLVRVRASLISAGTERSVVDFAEKNLLQKAMARPDLVRQLVDKAKREGWLTTLEAARNRLDSEMVLGYSNAGEVIEVGESVTEFRPGDRVACAGGGFASHSEIVRIPRTLAAVIPSGIRDVSFEEAAFATVASIAMHGVRLAQVQIGDVVAVIGMGLIGQIAIQLLKANGCVVIGMDPSAQRCRLAEQMGCIATATSDEEMMTLVRRVSAGRGADEVLILAATESDGPVTLAGEIARDRGVVVAVGAVGMKLPRKPYYMKELDFRISRSYGPGRYDNQYEEKGRDYPVGYVRWTEGRNLEAILQLQASGKIDFRPLITHRFLIDEAEKGYELISGRTGEPFLGVLIQYPHDGPLERRIDLRQEKNVPAATPSSVCVGVIGAGNFARATLLPAMKAAGGLAFGGICASGGTSARSAGSRMGFRFCASDSAELLQDRTINTIVIATRHSGHAQQAIAALEAGKHVFCEKPLAISEEQLAAVARAYYSAEPKPLLMVGYNRRFAPLAVRMKEFFRGVGEPFVMHYRVNAGFIPTEHWVQDPDQGGGRVIGEVCHFVDFLSYLCGQPVVHVSAQVMPDVGRYSRDNLTATLRFADGSVGSITYVANGDKAYSKERVEVFAQGRIAVLEDFRELRMVRDGKRSAAKLRLRVDKGHRGEWIAFGDAIRRGGRAPIAFEELVNSTLATLAITHAAQDGSQLALNSHAFLQQVQNNSGSALAGEEN